MWRSREYMTDLFHSQVLSMTATIIHTIIDGIWMIYHRFSVFNSSFAFGFHANAFYLHQELSLAFNSVHFSTLGRSHFTFYDTVIWYLFHNQMHKEMNTTIITALFMLSSSDRQTYRKYNYKSRYSNLRAQTYDMTHGIHFVLWFCLTKCRLSGAPAAGYVIQCNACDTISRMPKDTTANKQWTQTRKQPIIKNPNWRENLIRKRDTLQIESRIEMSNFNISTTGGWEWISAVIPKLLFQSMNYANHTLYSISECQSF